MLAKAALIAAILISSAALTLTFESADSLANADEQHKPGTGSAAEGTHDDVTDHGVSPNSWDYDAFDLYGIPSSAHLRRQDTQRQRSKGGSLARLRNTTGSRQEAGRPQDDAHQHQQEQQGSATRLRAFRGRTGGSGKYVLPNPNMPAIPEQSKHPSHSNKTRKADRATFSRHSNRSSRTDRTRPRYGTGFPRSGTHSLRTNTTRTDHSTSIPDISPAMPKITYTSNGHTYSRTLNVPVSTLAPRSSSSDERSRNSTANEVASTTSSPSNPQPSNICGCWYSFVCDHFEIYGKNFDASKIGENGEALQDHLKGCGALTAWGFKRLRGEDDPNGFQWFATGNMPIGVGGCLGNKMVALGGQYDGCIAKSL